MDQRERANPYEESLLAMMDGRQAQIWTCLPGIIQSFDAAAMTAVVQPSIMGLQRAADGSTKLVKMPVLADCPVIFPSGGGCTLTFPIAAGDECKISFSSRCIDAWWQSGGIQPQAEYRMHDLSDGFVEVGPRSQPRVLENISATATELRSDDGETKVSLDPTAQMISLTAPGGIFLNGIHWDIHHHGGVQSGSSNTSGPA
jgi:hypothetical protein